MNIIETFPTRNCITYVTEPSGGFEAAYCALRTRENRMYSDQELRELPSFADRHVVEWSLRAEAAGRFMSHLTSRPLQTILEIGCGNGWFSNLVANKGNWQVLALDLNETELIQGAGVFQRSNLRFLHGDIFDEGFDALIQELDVVYLAASVQYFQNFSKVVRRALSFLHEGGELHILDSPFYARSEQIQAATRSEQYYAGVGFPEMAQYYFHHTWEDIAAFDHEFLFRPSFWQRWVKRNRSPFPWVKIKPEV